MSFFNNKKFTFKIKLGHSSYYIFKCVREDYHCAEKIILIITHINIPFPNEEICETSFEKIATNCIMDMINLHQHVLAMTSLKV